MEKAIKSMTTLNKYASEIIRKYEIHACTDVTGFGLLGHLHEMLQNEYTAVLQSKSVPYIKEAYDYANEFLLTAAGQRNRNFVENYIDFETDDFAIQEILFDPQTSGGLLFSINPEDASKILKELESLEMPCAIIGEITKLQEKEIIIK